jgi:hypothetical protein
MDSHIHTFFTSELVGDNWSISHSGRLHPTNEHTISLLKQAVWTLKRSGRRGEEKVLTTTGFKLLTSVLQAEASSIITLRSVLRPHHYTTNTLYHLLHDSFRPTVPLIWLYATDL